MDGHQTTEVDTTIRAAHAIVAARYFLRSDSIPTGAPLSNDIIHPITSANKRQLAKDFAFSIVYANLRQYYTHSDHSLYITTESSHRVALEAHAFLEGVLHPTRPDTTSLTWFHKQPLDTPLVLPNTASVGHPDTGGALSIAYGMTLHNPQHSAICFIDDMIAETSSENIAWHTVSYRSKPTDHGAILPILILSENSPLWNINTYQLLALFIGRGYEPRLVDCTASLSFTQINQTIAKEIAWLDQTATKYTTSSISSRNTPRQPLLIIRPPAQPFVAQSDKPSNQSSTKRTLLDSSVDQTTIEYLTRLFSWCNSLDSSYRTEPREISQRSAWYSGASSQHDDAQPSRQALTFPPIEDVTVVATPPGSTQADTISSAYAYLRAMQQNNDSSQFCTIYSSITNALPFIEDTAKITVPTPLLYGIAQGYIASGRQPFLLTHARDTSRLASAIGQYHTLLPSDGTDSTKNTPITSYNHLIHSTPQQSLDCLDEILSQPHTSTTIYLPADANCTAVATTLALTSRRRCNIICAGAVNQPSWLTTKAARAQMLTGLAIWNFASHPDPNIVLAGAGDTAMAEIIAAIGLVAAHCSKAHIRCINISSFTPTNFGTAQRQIPQRVFNRIFTKDKPVIINFIGRPYIMSALLSQYAVDPHRVIIHGHTVAMPHATVQTTLRNNHTSRYDIATSTIAKLKQNGVISAEEAQHATLAINKIQDRSSRQ